MEEGKILSNNDKQGSPPKVSSPKPGKRVTGILKVGKLEITLPKANNGKLIHACPICKDTFSQLWNLKVHVRTRHFVGEQRPFKCTAEGCKKSFKQKVHMQRHMKVIHKIESSTTPRVKARGPKEKKRHRGESPGTNKEHDGNESKAMSPEVASVQPVQSLKLVSVYPLVMVPISAPTSAEDLTADTFKEKPLDEPLDLSCPVVNFKSPMGLSFKGPFTASA